jgi:hypothetical protein
MEQFGESWKETIFIATMSQPKPIPTTFFFIIVLHHVMMVGRD